MNNAPIPPEDKNFKGTKIFERTIIKYDKNADKSDLPQEKNYDQKLKAEKIGEYRDCNYCPKWHGHPHWRHGGRCHRKDCPAESYPRGAYGGRPYDCRGGRGRFYRSGPRGFYREGLRD